ncbi:MAG: TrfB-related DNA-binding protein [Dehalococcoidia bacterium]|nr:TrfB-related DNA-binding protein [Dehalococcoidia bacterium]
MKKRLSEAQFQACTRGLKVGKQTLDIAHGVLVKRIKQIVFVKALGLSTGAISQAVNRVWAAHREQNLPQGYRRISAVLPEYQVYIVEKWAQIAAKKQESNP